MPEVVPTTLIQIKVGQAMQVHLGPEGCQREGP